MEALRSENNLLKSRVRLLQLQNDELLRLHNDSGQKKREVSTLVEQRLILEDFEGEGRVSVGEFLYFDLRHFLCLDVSVVSGLGLCPCMHFSRELCIMCASSLCN